MIITISDHVALRKAPRRYNEKAAGKKDVPFPVHDFRMRRLFGYAERSDPDDKFGRLISFHNELSHATFNMKADWCTMITLSCRHREYLWESFGLTPNDVLELVIDVKSLIAEFKHCMMWKT